MLLPVLLHAGALGILWGLGLARVLWRGAGWRRMLAALAFGGLLAGLWSGAGGAGAAAQWWAFAALILAGPLPPRPARPAAADLLALALLPAPGAVGAAVVLAGSGALHPGAPARRWLLLTVAALLGAALWDAGSLSLWLAAQRHLHLGMDPASYAVDLGEQALRAVAWAAALARGPGGEARRA